MHVVSNLEANARKGEGKDAKEAKENHQKGNSDNMRLVCNFSGSKE